MTIVRVLAFTSLILLLISLLSLNTRADGVSLTLSAVSGSPGSTLTVDGTIANNGADTVYLNGEDFSLASSLFLNGDVTDFFLNAPLSLDPGTDSGLIDLFTFDIAAGTPSGVDSGNFLNIIGGTDPSDFTDVLASAEFPITVEGAEAAPEPSTLLLLGTGLLCLGGRLWRKRQLANTIGVG